MPSLFLGPQHKNSWEQGLGQEVGVKAPCPPALWGWGGSRCPFGVKYSPVGYGTAVWCSQPSFPLLFVGSFIHSALTC